MSSIRILSCPSAENLDTDHYFLIPEAWTYEKAVETAAKVHQDFQGSPDPEDWEAFGEAMVAAGFISLEFIAGPTWDRKPLAGSPLRSLPAPSGV